MIVGCIRFAVITFGYISSLRHGDARASVNLSNSYATAILAHEATHVWQQQRGVRVTLKGTSLQLSDQWGIDPYAYDRAARVPLKLLAQFL